MRRPNIHVVFSPKKNFEELQLHQKFKFFFWILAYIKILAFSTKECPWFS